MRENNLLSPHRCRRRGGNPHVGEIITHAPNLMWGTDGVRVFTVDDGWGWIFTASSIGTPSASAGMCASEATASPPFSRSPWGLRGCMPRPSAGAARGLALRMDHGSQYLSDHFTNQIKFWGIQPSYAFVEQPQTNGVAERFNRTLKEQIIHGRMLPQHRGAAERRPRVRSNSTMPKWIVDPERLPEPRSSSSGVAHRDVTSGPAALETNLCPTNRVRYSG